jgi:hypothetical protein
MYLTVIYEWFSAAITEGKRYNPTQNGALPQFHALTPLSPLRAHSPATQGEFISDSRMLDGGGQHQDDLI